MNHTVYLWTAIIGCYGLVITAIIGISAFVLNAFRGVSNHTATTLNNFGQKLDDMAEDVAYIKGRLDGKIKG